MEEYWKNDWKNLGKWKNTGRILEESGRVEEH
jgi:hypothetical protein